jgi:hypothetical protein
MTSTQSAETYIANGLEFKTSDIEITAPKVNKVGGKSSNILYRPTKKGLYLNMKVPMLTWGASIFKDPQSGKETYDMAIQFPRKEYSTPETDTLLKKFQQLEQFIKSEAIKNSMAWFNKKTMTPEVIEALWTPMLKYTKDPQTGEPDMTKAPTLKIKLPCWDGKFNCEIYDPSQQMLYPNDNGINPVELIPKGINIVAIIQCGGLWFANGKFGCTWRLFQAVVQSKPSMKGKCLISMSSADKTALTNVSNKRDEEEQEEVSGVVVEDDSDHEEETSEPAQAQAQAAPAPAPAQAAQAQAAPAAQAQAASEVEEDTKQVDSSTTKPVVKKKIVRKKD